MGNSEMQNFRPVMIGQTWKEQVLVKVCRSWSLILILDSLVLVCYW